MRRRGSGASLICGLSPTVVLCVACASSFSFLLGYDIGIMSSAKRLIAHEFALSEGELSLLVGVLNLVSGPGGLLSGRLADSMGRRPSAALACAVTLLGAVLMASAPNCVTPSLEPAIPKVFPQCASTFLQLACRSATYCCTLLSHR